VQASEDRKEAGRHWEILAAINAEWVGERMRGEAVTGGGGGDPTTTTTNDSRSTTPIAIVNLRPKPTPSSSVELNILLALNTLESQYAPAEVNLTGRAPSNVAERETHPMFDSEAILSYHSFHHAKTVLAPFTS
jgi:hypothetical protein